MDNKKVLRSDNGKEEVNKDLDDLLTENAIRHEFTVPYTPQQNGCAERDMTTIEEMAR